MSDMKSVAVSDTCMFFFGTCIGVVVNFMFSECITFFQLSEKHHFFTLGMLQILLISFIIQFIQGRVNSIGLFTLGLLTTQSLVIKKCYKLEK